MGGPFLLPMLYTAGYLEFLRNASLASIGFIGGEGAGAIVHAIGSRITFAGIDKKFKDVRGMGASKVIGKLIASNFFYAAAGAAGGSRVDDSWIRDALHGAAVVNAAAIPVDIFDTVMSWREFQKKLEQMGEVEASGYNLHQHQVRSKKFDEFLGPGKNQGRPGSLRSG